MILVDTGVLIDFCRTADPKLGSLFATLPVAVCGIVRAELLHGYRNLRDRARLVMLLNQFAQHPIEESLWDTVGDHLHSLRTNGVTVPFPDVVLVTIALQSNFELWTRDSHFSLIQQVLPSLKLFSEPP